MPKADAPPSDASPRQPIRRFDVFAEYTRQERREKGFPEDEAKGRPRHEVVDTGG